MEHCSKAYNIRCANNTSVMQYIHQWELEQKKTDDLKVPMVDSNSLAKTMKNIALHLNLMRRVRGTPLAYVVWHHIKIAYILPGYSVQLTLDENMIAIVPIVDDSGVPR